MNSHVSFANHGGLTPDQQDDNAEPMTLHIQTGLADMTPLASAAPQESLAIAQRSEVTFIESDVPDLQTLLDGLGGAEVHVIDSSQDGLQQIASILAGRSGIDALHIISHGASATLDLGALTLDSNGLAAHQAELSAIGQSLSADGDIMLYGCDVGASTAGKVFIDQLARATGADVAASTNLTGSAGLGGDWNLEISSGHIETNAVVDPALAAHYHQVLAIASTTLNFGTPGNFANNGSKTDIATDIIYNVTGNSGYQFRINGLDKGIVYYATGSGYIVSDSATGNGEREIDFSFDTNQVFTPTSLRVTNYQSTGAQKLIFKGYDAAGNQVGIAQLVNTSATINQYVTVNFSGLTNIAKLKLTADPTSSSPGKLEYLVFDDFAMSNVQPGAATVSGVSASTADGSYTVGQTIAVSVTFSAGVSVTGTPQLLLATGGSGHTANYISGSGSPTLIFNYTVQAGDTSADLDAFGTTALSLNGGTIRSTSGAVAATLTLPTPGTAGSLGANKAIVLDTTAPAAPTAPAMDTASDKGSSSSDGITTVTTPTFTGTAEANSTVKLYDTNGTTLLGTTTANGGGSWTITSSVLAEGSHSLSVKASDTAGNVSAASSISTVVIDTTAPAAPSTPSLSSASDKGSSSSDRITNVTTPTFSGTSEASAAIKLYDADGTTVVGTTVADGSGNWSVSTTALSSGVHSISAKATDVAGNVGAASSASTLTIDTTAPTVSITSDAAALKAGETATVTFTFSEDPGATFTWSGTAGDVVVSGGTLSAISGTGLTRTATFTPAAATDASSASITVAGASYQDLAGNGGGAGTSPTLTIDTLANAPTIQGLNAGSDSGTLGDGITNVGTPTVTGHSEAGAAVRLYDTDGTTLLGSVTADGGGNWSVTSNTLASGAHTLTAKQTDVAGNVSVASSGYAYLLDTVGPTSIALSSTTVSLGNATNGSTVATLSATDATAVGYGLAVGDGVNNADNGKFTISGTQLVAAQTLTAGTYHIYTKATDAAGNDSFQAFSVDVVDAPSVSSILRVSSATVPTSSTSINYTVTFSQSVTGVDASDFALTATGSASGTLASVTGSGTTYTVTVNGVSGDGTLRLDLNGSGTGIVNGSGTAIGGGYTAGQTFTLDHTAAAAPSIPVMTSGTDTGLSGTDGITSNTTPVFTGTAEANATVRLYDTDGTTLLGTTTANGSGGWSITSSALAGGSHTVTAKQSDAAGNTSVASTGLAVVIDTGAAAPSTPVLSALSDSGTLGDGVTNIATPTITGTAEANASITLYDTDGVTVLGTTTANGAGTWSITSSTLSNASHTLTTKQTDLAGNVSAASSALTLTVNTAAPVAPSTPVLSTASDSGTLGDGITNIATPVITGTAAANAVVKLYDSNGTTLLGSATANGSGNWSITSSALSLGAHTLTAKQMDVAGNVSVASTSLALTIEAAPVAPSGPATAPTVDGVVVTQQSVSLPGGGTGIQTIIPIVTTDRVDSSGSSGVADIPLVTGSNGNLLQAQVAAGFGLTASGGASQPAGTSTDQLIKSILAVTPGNTASDQNHLTGNGVTFLNKLVSTVPLLVETIVPSSGTTAPSGALTLTGTSNGNQHTALVIDASHLPAQSNLVLNAVDFAAVIGSVNVTANTSGQTLTGDASNQQFTVAAGSASSVFAGGGNDTLHVTAPLSNTGAQTVAASSTILQGGTGNDTAVFDGASSNYTVQAHEGYFVVIAKTQPSQQVVVINAESLAFSDSTFAIQVRDAQTTLAGLYKETLGRQADYLGFDYWASMEKNGTSLGQIAIAILNSNESKAQHALAFNGNNSNDIEVLYQGIYGRHSEANGLAYWVTAMQQGMTLEQVAQNFATANEMAAHKIAAQSWDFLVP
jgi:hypothetical protein